jgi:hypothetical protein
MTGQIDQLERETEQARTKVASSLDALRDRLTPEEVVQEALDYARETRVGQAATSVSRNVLANSVPLIVAFAGIAWTCMAIARRSEQRIIDREVTAQTRPEPIPAETDLFVAHEGWGVERVQGPAQ